DPLASTDPQRVTGQWRDARVGRPENAMMGQMYGLWIWVDAPLSVEDASSWVWTGAGVAQGTAIAGIYGDEADRRLHHGADPAGVLPPSYRAGTNVSTVTTALNAPAAIGVALNGDAIVADGDQIVRVTPAGAVSVIAGSSTGSNDGPAALATFNGPRGVAVAA